MDLKSYIRNAIPPQHIYRLLHLRKNLPFLGGATLKCYSGNGEDIILVHHLFRNKKDGFYVDVGSFHPKVLSNTYQLHKDQNWSGINIDPNSQVQQLFKKYRPKDVNLQIGIAEEAGEKTYYNFSYSGTNTFDEGFAEIKAKKDWNTLLSKEQLLCLPLRTVLEKHLPSGRKIDLLDIDVEGLDLQVLKSNDWSKYRPSVILVEDREFRDDIDKSKIYNYLCEQNYKFYCYQGITLVMTEKDFRANNS